MQETRRRPVLVIVIMTLTGMGVGFLTGKFVGDLLSSAERLRLSWSDHAAMLLALTLLCTGLTSGLLATHRFGLAFMTNPYAPEFKRPPRPGQAAYIWLQAGVLILAGVMLGAPVLAEILRGPLVKEITLPLMGGIILAFALQTGLNIGIWVRSDEVVRKVIAESGAASFWLFQGAFFLWACGEKLKLAPTISSWDAVTVLMGLYLVMSTIVFYRRGLA